VHCAIDHNTTLTWRPCTESCLFSGDPRTSVRVTTGWFR